MCFYYENENQLINLLLLSFEPGQKGKKKNYEQNGTKKKKIILQIYYLHLFVKLYELPVMCEN